MMISEMNLLTNGMTCSTKVTFPERELTGQSKIIGVAAQSNGKIALILEKTPFHPVDRAWPDQPADKGTITLVEGDKTYEVEDCQILSVHRETQEVRNTEIPKAEREQWFQVVAHIIDPKEKSPDGFVDAEVTAQVDKVYRERLSLQHSASHLAAFALNLATKSYWTKVAPRLDSLQSPNIDQIAMDTSFIFTDHCEDQYRFGQSIKKKGLQVDRLFSELDQIQASVNQQLKEWIATASPVSIRKEGECLDHRRVWTTALPQGVLEMPCGGSHVATLEAFKEITYLLQTKESPDKGERLLFAVTKAVPK